MAPPSATSSVSTNQLRKAIVYLALWSGVLLTALLPIGMYSGLKSGYFDTFFWLHLGFLILAALFSVLLFLRCALRASFGGLLTFAAFVAALVVLAVESTHPITSRDALIHHLAVPRWWVEAGAIVRIPWHEWSHYPMLINLGFTGLMMHGWDQLTPFYHALYLITCCGVVASFVLYKSQEYIAAALSYVILLTIPVCMRLASTPLVDLGLCLYTAIAFCHLIYWAEGKHRFLHLLIAGLAMGLALSCKYNGLLMAAVLFAALIFLVRQSKLSFGMYIKACVFVGLCALVVYLPWVAKNVAWTNNPFYPLFNSYFSISSGPPASRSVPPLTHRVALYGESAWEILAIPFRMLVFGEDGNPRRFDGVLSPILLLSLVPLYRMRREPWVTYSWVLLVLYMSLALLMSSARVRYLAPLYAPAVILSALGLWRLSLLGGGKARTVVYAAAFSLAFGWSAWHAEKLLSESEAVPFINGEFTPQEYLSRHIAEYPVIEFVNAAVPDDSIIYLLNTGNRFYYFDKQVTSSGHFSASAIIAWIRSSSSSDFLRMEFQNRNIGYLMTNTDLSRRTFQEMLSLDERALWNDFQEQHLELMHSQRGFSVWKIR